jgi:predicted DNA-binding protein (MmcQ/YjbR family)
MTPDSLLEFCLSLPQVVEEFPFGDEVSVFKTSGNGKIFALSALGGHPFTVSLKCDPEDSIALRAEFPQITPGYHLNKKHWITIVLDSSTRAAQSGRVADVPGASDRPGVSGVSGVSGASDGAAVPGPGVPDELVEQLIRGSHSLVRPKVPRGRAIG